jgi:hypothetical protein
MVPFQCGTGMVQLHFGTKDAISLETPIYLNLYKHFLVHITSDKTNL